MAVAVLSVGFRGQRFDFLGEAGKVFAWYSDIDVQINFKLDVNPGIVLDALFTIFFLFDLIFLEGLITRFVCLFVCLM